MKAISLVYVRKSNTRQPTRHDEFLCKITFASGKASSMEMSFEPLGFSFKIPYTGKEKGSPNFLATL
jgi:hypothetical protein